MPNLIVVLVLVMIRAVQSFDEVFVEQAVEQVFASEAGGPGQQDMLRCQVHGVSPLLHGTA